jgi:DNA-binding XRE family transcriptional regulator
VARDLGISKQLLHAYEMGLCLPGYETKKKIARYYGQTVGALFYGEGKMKSDRRTVKKV